MKIALIVLGALLVIVGCVWFLQGINVIPGSFMTGQSKWTLIGAVCAIAGIGLIVAGSRRS